MFSGARIKYAFLQFRRGPIFVFFLAGALTTWFTLRHFFGFDPDNSWANLALSIEASVATSWLLDMQLRQTAADTERMEEIQSEVEVIQSDVEDIHQELIEVENECTLSC